MEGTGGRRATTGADVPQSQSVANSSDQRFAPRRRLGTPALIRFDHRPDLVSCIIRDMSTTGARLELRDGWDKGLEVDASRMLPLRLIMRHDRTVYECVIVRHDEGDLGVKFVTAPSSFKRVGR